MLPFADILICLRFLSRLPVPATHREAALGASGLVRAAAMAPMAGAILGGLQAVVLTAAAALPATVAAGLAVAAGVVLTGALHEDGLADCADGFGGGRDRAHKLAIMRDSRIGTYGAIAVALSLLLRTAALAAILMPGRGAGARDGIAAGLAGGAAALVRAGAISRAAALLPLAALPPARCDGVAALAGRPTPAALAGMALTAAIAAATCAASLSAPRVAAAVAVAAAAVALLLLLARQQIGGHTGDVAGAAQQLAEAAILVALSAG